MQSRQTKLYVSIIITFTVACFSLVARLVSRRLKRAQLWYDDLMCGASFIVAAGLVGISFWWMSHGLGLHLQDIPRPKEVVFYDSNRALWIADLVYAGSLAFSKMSILLFYWRLFSNTSIRQPIRALFACAVIWLTIRIILTVIQCLPPKAYWDPSVKNATCPINPSKFFFGTVLVHLLMDVVIIALPAWELRRLHLPVWKKVGISAMFASGVFVCCASILQLISSFDYDPFSEDVGWNIAPVVMWANVEVNLSIMSTCLPMLRPIYTALYLRRRPDPSPDRGRSSYKTSDRESSRRKQFEWLSGFTQIGRDGVLESDSTHQLQPVFDRHGKEEEGNDGYAEREEGQEGLVMGVIARNARGRESGLNMHPMGIVVKSDVAVEVSVAG